MFDKIGQAAEKIALGVSRRAFLSRLGKSALAAAGALGFAASASASPPAYTCCACYYPGAGWYHVCIAGRGCFPGCRKVARQRCCP
jgi:hypothetical protein